MIGSDISLPPSHSKNAGKNKGAQSRDNHTNSSVHTQRGNVHSPHTHAAYNCIMLKAKISSEFEGFLAAWYDPISNLKGSVAQL